MNISIAFELGVAIGLFLKAICCKIFGIDNKCCNSKYNRKKDSLVIELEMPEYKVSAIKQTHAKGGGGWISEYTLENFYISGKNDVTLQTLTLYDEIGKYNIGDVLILNKKNICG